ncbi:MAG: hypothetical protein ABI691_22005 [Ginsengibacter sp.]
MKWETHETALLNGTYIAEYRIHISRITCRVHPGLLVDINKKNPKTSMMSNSFLDSII